MGGHRKPGEERLLPASPAPPDPRAIVPKKGLTKDLGAPMRDRVEAPHRARRDRGGPDVGPAERPAGGYLSPVTAFQKLEKLE